MPNNCQNIANKKWPPVAYSTPGKSNRKKLKVRYTWGTKYGIFRQVKPKSLRKRKNNLIVKKI